MRRHAQSYRLRRADSRMSRLLGDFYQSAYFVSFIATPCEREYTSKTFLPPQEVDVGSSDTDLRPHSARPVIGSTGIFRRYRTSACCCALLVRGLAVPVV